MEDGEPPPPLESMKQAQALISQLQSLTKALHDIVPGSTGLVPPGPLTSTGRVQIIEPNKEEFLRLLDRGAVSDEEIAEKFKAIQRQQGVDSIFVNPLSVPPTGEAKQLIASRTDAFKSNAEQIHHLINCTGKRGVEEELEEALNSGIAPVELEERARLEDPEATGPFAVAMNTKGASDRTYSLFQQKIRSMRADFDQKYIDGIVKAKEEGFAEGHVYGAAFAQEELKHMRQRVAELESRLMKFTGVAERTFMEKESTTQKASFIRAQKEQWLRLAQQYADVNIEELVRERDKLKEERDYLHAQAMRSSLDGEPKSVVLTCQSPKREAVEHLPERKHCSPRVLRRQRSVIERLLQMQESLSSQLLELHDRYLPPPVEELSRAQMLGIAITAQRNVVAKLTK
jgi:hypothetical protein